MARLTGRTYVFVWIGLVVLTALSFGTSLLGAGPAEAAAALGIATVKAALVATFFMHLIEARFANRLVVLVSAVFIALLCTLILADVGFRQTFPPAPEMPNLQP